MLVVSKQLRDYGKVLEFQSRELDSCFVQLYRQAQSGRTNLAMLLRFESQTRYRSETLGSGGGDLLDELMEFRRRLQDFVDEPFVSACSEAIHELGIE